MKSVLSRKSWRFFCFVLIGLGAFLGIYALASDQPKPMISPLPTSSPLSEGEKPVLIVTAVGQVGDRVLSSRDVKLAHLVEKAVVLFGTKAKKINFEDWWLKDQSQAFRAQLNQTMLELVVNLEAENFKVAEASATEVREKAQFVAGLFKDWSEWKTQEFTSPEIETAILRRLRAKSFLRFKTESEGVQVSEEDAKIYFEKNRQKFGSLPFENFRVNIKEYLAQEQLEDRLKDWFEVLKRKYHVRFLGAYK